MADEKIVFGLDLDSKDFVKGLGEAKNSLAEMADAKGLQGLVNSFLSFSPIIAGIGVALFALKKTFDFAEEAEQIRLIETQFDLLAESAGVAGDALRDGLAKSAHGLVDTTDLLGIANKAFIQLGQSASRLPEIIDISTKMTKVFGRTTEEISEMIIRGVATQNTRSLRRIGITIDSEKAQRDYAKSIGATASQLSQEGKQQAILNAILDQTSDKYKKIDIESSGFANAGKRVKVAWREAFEAFISWFEKTEPMWKKALSALEFYGETVRKVFHTTDMEKQEKQIQSLQDQWLKLDASIDDLNERRKGANATYEAYLDKEISGRMQARDAIMEQLKAVQALGSENEKSKSPVEEKTETKEQDTGVDYEKRRQDEAKFNADVLAMRSQRAMKEQDMATTVEQADRIMSERKLLLEQQYFAQVEQIKANQDITDQQRNELVYQSKMDMNQKLMQLEDERANNHARAEDNMVQKSKTASDGMASAFNQMSRKNERDLKNWGKTGQMVATSFANNMTSAIQAWADGSKSASEAIKGFMFGLIADTAEAKGREMLLAGIYPPNGPAIYGGVGLIALAAVLRAKSGGSKGGSIGDTGGGGGGAPSSSINIPETPQLEKPEVEAAKKRSVTVNIQGNVLGNDSFQREIVEMIRREGDATDFKYFQVQG